MSSFHENSSSPDTFDRELDSNNGSHVFISYNHLNLEMILRIRDYLNKEGFRTWVDQDDMVGSVTEAMADAVENASVVLICMSEKYQESRNCRAEANYAFRMKKPIVPLRLQTKFYPTGWLGFIAEFNVVYDFSSEVNFRSNIKRLVKELQPYNSNTIGEDSDDDDYDKEADDVNEDDYDKETDDDDDEDDELIQSIYDDDEDVYDKEVNDDDEDDYNIQADDDDDEDDHDKETDDDDDDNDNKETDDEDYDNKESDDDEDYDNKETDDDEDYDDEETDDSGENDDEETVITMKTMTISYRSLHLTQHQNIFRNIGGAHYLR